MQSILILGCGNMGGAMLAGWLGGGLAAPALTAKDLTDISSLTQVNPDFVAVSFVSSAADIFQTRELLAEHDLQPAIIAKIERAEALVALEEIIEAADVVIMNDDLMRVPETIVLSRRTFRILRQNIALALGIKGLFLVLTVAGNATMWMAVFADMGTSLIVIANGLRLLRTPTLGKIKG